MKQQMIGGKDEKQSKSSAPIFYRATQDEDDIPVTLLITSYATGNLAIVLQTDADGELEDYAIITVNFSDELLLPNQAYLDINNVSGIDQFVKKHRLGKETGREKISGFCTYPLYEFDLARCLEHGRSENPIQAA